MLLGTVRKTLADLELRVRFALEVVRSDQLQCADDDIDLLQCQAMILEDIGTIFSSAQERRLTVERAFQKLEEALDIYNEATSEAETITLCLTM